MGKEKKTSTEQQPLLYIVQPKSSQPVGDMQKVFIVKQNSIEQYQLDLDKEDKSESLPNVPSSEVESVSVDNEAEIEKDVEEKSFSFEEESVSVDNEEEIEKDVEEKPFSFEEESVSVDNEAEIEKDVEEKLFSFEKESVSVDNEVEIEKDVEEKLFSFEEESVSVDNKAEIEEKKVFTQMTNVEKINYVLNRPHYIPNIQYAVQTKKKVYVGYIVSFEKEVLKMKSSIYFDFVTIALADIETIQMKGLA
ncbi:CotO family spore coat protein [Bacillus sp. DX1.1]|uniref:CotO family spore coat protein n=1 Tax=unclassified Bacillus (in: firmicutes) TaxID=185979 RepID=UPI0025706BFC|nr:MULTISPECIES: CotO family spore coat protein [unclassified Bacillus (in: firmicutes)]MDM5153862.1 CotO family spore coat protein [Bacillus sp. DX1.1]WJE82797.1 CotO family spore coat protein [Bacillus sp. DX3.1]